MAKAQNYKNHVRHDKRLYFCLLMIVTSIGLAIAGLFASVKFIAAAVIVGGVATILLSIIARGYATKLQDRIIRTEMRLRLKELYKSDPMNRVNDFTLPQLLGLRFASDTELAELSQIVLDEHVTDADTVKQLIENWNPDHLRV